MTYDVFGRTLNLALSIYPKAYALYYQLQLLLGSCFALFLCMSVIIRVCVYLLWLLYA